MNKKFLRIVIGIVACLAVPVGSAAADFRSDVEQAMRESMPESARCQRNATSSYCAFPPDAGIPAISIEFGGEHILSIHIETRVKYNLAKFTELFNKFNFTEDEVGNCVHQIIEKANGKFTTEKINLIKKDKILTCGVGGWASSTFGPIIDIDPNDRF